ncbi:protein TolR [Caldichromatium japonicum]|uniref:Tol-Pal system protein TolR n=1 Tax=Caldichromatium japonicum TaxID=2699430 RepID=A0A6G7VC16_9GAMM|nr:protein TolR [Caldichromatium japonicum]QIK37561.1 protein TolR [Caldichromatium japonicum]
MIRRRRNRRPLMAEINVVPYIDVMLVLLVIFMVTAPLITTGVKVDLPRVATGPLTGSQTEAVVISIDRAGDYYLDIGEDRGQPTSEEMLYDRLRVVLGYRPGTPVLVRGDAGVNYGRVVRAMSIAQQAGAAEIGLITMPPHDPENP